jgi:hypothetical protein
LTLTVGVTDFVLPVTVLKTDTDTNTTIDNLVSDVNAALLSALPSTLGGKIVAAKAGTALVLRIADASITEVGFSAAIDDPAVLELGLTNEATITQPRIEAVRDLVSVVGRLPEDATITITTTGGTGPTGTVTLFADDTAGNTTILGLVSDLNKALSVPTLKTGVLGSFAPSSDVTFSVKIGTGAPVVVTLHATDTDADPDKDTGTATNTSLSDLVEDINAALAEAGWCLAVPSPRVRIWSHHQV